MSFPDDSTPESQDATWNWEDAATTDNETNPEEEAASPELFGADVDELVSPITEELTTFLDHGAPTNELFEDWLDYIIAGLEAKPSTQESLIEKYSDYVGAGSDQQASLGQFGSTDDPVTTAEDTLNKATQLLIENSQSYGYDLIGEVFVSLDLTNDDLGQDYTPRAITEMMVSQTVDDTELDQMDGETVSTPKLMGDPSCGSGRFLISLADPLREADEPPVSRIMGQDIDLRAAKMSVVNCTIFGIPSFIIQGDTLLDESNQVWRVGPVCQDRRPTLVNELAADVLPDGFSSFPNGTAQLDTVFDGTYDGPEEPPETVFGDIEYRTIPIDQRLYDPYFERYEPLRDLI